MIARFIKAYGHDFFFNQRWPTRDHIIPFKHFFVMLNALGYVNAAEQLQDVFAVGHGLAMVWNGKEARVKSQTRRLIRGANPEVL